FEVGDAMGGVVEFRHPQGLPHPGVPGFREVGGQNRDRVVRRFQGPQLGVTMDDKVPMVTQERAYTSPIWYTP
ncbi:MAG: DUF3604 domain-containing protein, partial [Halioglobus sp.]